jgi:hypothetical protein
MRYSKSAGPEIQESGGRPAGWSAVDLENSWIKKQLDGWYYTEFFVLVARQVDKRRHSKVPLVSASQKWLRISLLGRARRRVGDAWPCSNRIEWNIYFVRESGNG